MDTFHLSLIRSLKVLKVTSKKNKAGNYIATNLFSNPNGEKCNDNKMKPVSLSCWLIHLQVFTSKAAFEFRLTRLVLNLLR